MQTDGSLDDETATPQDEARNGRVYRALDLVVALFFVVMGCVVLQQVATELPLMMFGQVGPGMLPFAVGTLLVVMGLVVVAQNLRAPVTAAAGRMPTLYEGSRVASVVVMLILTILLIPVLGTVVTLAIFIFIETRMVERRSWLVSLSTAIIVPLFIYATFDVMLGVALPAGVLGLR
jgi:hypothetical protein